MIKTHNKSQSSEAVKPISEQMTTIKNHANSHPLNGPLTQKPNDKWPWSKLTLTLFSRSGSGAECGLTTGTTVAGAGTTGCLVLAVRTCPTHCSGCGILTRLADNCDQWKRLKKYMATHFCCLSSLFNRDQYVKLFWACLRGAHCLSLSQCKSPHCVMQPSAASIILVFM